MLAALALGLGHPFAGNAEEAMPPSDWAGQRAADYDACLQAALVDPEATFEKALKWRDLGGGAPARHCAAVAVYALGHFKEAAARFEAIVHEEKNLPAKLQASLLSQAGHAWRNAGENERAASALGAALKHDPDNLDALIERSLMRAAAKQYWEAIDDLNQVIDLRPNDADALVLRASVYRDLESIELAGDDVARALTLDPAHAGALLERGTEKRLQGDAAGARADWLKVLTLAPEDTPVAEAARRDLEALDVKTE